jgi:hypothetical protein
MLESENISKFNIRFLKGRVIEIFHIAVDPNTGIVYEQDVDFQLENKLIINISDNDLGCKKEDIGQEKSIQMMTAFRTSIEKCDRENPKIGIFPNPVNPSHSPIICGIIRNIVEPSEEKYKQFRRYATLDIGIGQLLIVLFKNHKEDFSQFHDGDCVLIKDGLLTVINVM